MTTLGDRIKKERTAKCWTQLELAQRSGVSETTINELENNPLRGTTRLVAIAKALRVNPEYLQTGKGPRQPVLDPADAYVHATDPEDLVEKLLEKGPQEIGMIMQLIAEKAIKQAK